MSNSGNVKVNGVYKPLAKTYTKVNGVWKTGEFVYSKVSGTWKEAWRDAFPMPSFLSYPSTITRGQTITWTTENVTNANYEYQVAYNGVFGSSTFTTNPTGTIVVTTDTTQTSFQMRIRAVAPTTHDSQSAWMTGTKVSLNAQTVATPTGLSYPSSIARGDKARIYWNVADVNMTYELHVHYNNGTNTLLTDTIIFSNKVSKTGQTYLDYNVTTDTGKYYIQFLVIAKKSGFFDSAPEYGTTITLGGQKLGTPTSVTLPVPTKETTVTVSWPAVTNAVQYWVEVDTDISNWTRVYWGSNRSFTYTVPNNSAKYLQFRVKATAPYYTDGDFKNSVTQTIQAPPLKSTTWKTTATHNWRPNYGGQWDGADPGTMMMQGEWTDSQGTWGNYKSLAFFDYNDIRSKLKGRTVVKTQVYLYRSSTPHGYHTGQPAEIYTHNYSSHPAKEPSMWYADGPSGSFGLGQGAWITVDNAVAERIRDGQAAGVGLYSPTGKYYCRFTQNVQLYVEYR